MPDPEKMGSMAVVGFAVKALVIRAVWSWRGAPGLENKAWEVGDQWLRLYKILPRKCYSGACPARGLEEAWEQKGTCHQCLESTGLSKSGVHRQPTQFCLLSLLQWLPKFCIFAWFCVWKGLTPISKNVPVFAFGAPLWQNDLCWRALVTEQEVTAALPWRRAGLGSGSGTCFLYSLVCIVLFAWTPLPHVSLWSQISPCYF